MMRWETHLHTAEASKCASASAAEMAQTCKDAGYDGMFVTDHFYHGNTCVDRSLPWEEWTRQFCLGYYHAKEAGDRIGLRVCFGWEYSWTGNDFLTYGLSPAWLAAHPEVVTVSPIEYLKLIRASGGCIVHAHPFRQEYYVEAIRLVPEHIDAVEVYNAGNKEEAYNSRALWYAEEFGFPQTAGSDAHWVGACAGGILTDADLTDTAQYPDLIRSGGIKGLIRGGKDFLF